MMKDKDVLHRGAITDVWRLPVKIWHQLQCGFVLGTLTFPFVCVIQALLKEKDSSAQIV